MTSPRADPLKLITTFDSASTAAMLRARAARQRDILAIDIDLWPYIVDIRIQEVSNKVRHRRIIMGDQVEVQVRDCFDGLLHWDPSLEGSEIAVGAYC